MASGEHLVSTPLPRVVRSAERSAIVAQLPALVIAGFTVICAGLGGVFARVLDPGDFRSMSDALWWSVQTVTTVGYGDVVPRHTEGRVIGTIIMLMGIGFLTVVTATVTAALVGSHRTSAETQSRAEISDQLAEISDRLGALESVLARRDEAALAAARPAGRPAPRS